MKKNVRQRLVSLLLACMMVLGLFPAALAADPADHIIINQVYGTGNNDDAPISSSFVELYNPTDAAVDLIGYILYNGSEDLALTGTIPANSSYLISGAVKTTADDKLTYDLPTADLTCDWVYEFLDTKAILVMPH